MYSVASAPAIFQKFIVTLFGGIKGQQAFYDDFHMSSESATEHLTRMREFFQRCCENGICLKLEKCQIMKSSIDYLGFHINENGLVKIDDKVEAEPKTKGM